jgi:hypothetical protein
MAENTTPTPTPTPPQAPTQATPAAPDAGAPRQDPPRTLHDLLRESEESTTPEQGEPGKARESASKAKPIEGLKDLAERLELKPEDLYKVKVPMANGESLTLGEIKDLAAGSGDLTEREMRFEEDRSRREGELLRAQSELQTLIAALPKGAIKPEVLEAVQARHTATLKRERELTLDVIPEWRDEAKRTEEITGMIEHLKGYGFPENYLGTLTDHRSLRYVRDNWRREQRVRKALEQVGKGAPPATGKSKPSGRAPALPAPTRPTKGSDPRSRLLALLNR